MSIDLETFREDFLTAMEAAILASDPGTASPTDLIVQSALLKAYDFVERYEGSIERRLAKIAEMTQIEFNAWIADIRNRFLLERVLRDPVANEIIFRDADITANIAGHATAMSAIAASGAAMWSIATSAPAMSAIAASSTAMAAVADSAIALSAIVKNATGRSHLLNSAHLQANATTIASTLNASPSLFLKLAENVTLTSIRGTNVGKVGYNSSGAYTVAASTAALRPGALFVFISMLGAGAGGAVASGYPVTVQHLGTITPAGSGDLTTLYTSSPTAIICVGGAGASNPSGTATYHAGIAFSAWEAV